MAFIRENIFAWVSVIVVSWSLYQFFQMFQSSLRLENKKAIFRLSDDHRQWEDLDLSVLSKHGYNNGVLHPLFISITPAEIELHLRYHLLNHDSQNYLRRDIGDFYQKLLKVRPTWPYYYSGLSQLAMLYGEVDESSLKVSSQYGYHEVKVVKSNAEVLFNSWNKLQKNTREQLLSQLTNQNVSLITSVVNISAKFAKIYHICDFIYEKKQVEYPACKDQYWQPLKRL